MYFLIIIEQLGNILHYRNVNVLINILLTLKPHYNVN